LKRAYRLLVKKKGEWVGYGEATTKGEALRRGEKWALSGLGATFKVQPTGEFIRTRGGETYTPSRLRFRGYKIKEGKKVPLKDTFIQRARKVLGVGSRLGTRKEVISIQKAKKQKGKLTYFGSPKKGTQHHKKKKGGVWFK
jgi:hypothetical protein